MHKPVMLEQVLDSLDIRGDDIVVDCTLGEGGHASAFLHRLNRGSLVGIEQDEEIFGRACERLKDFGEMFIPVRDNFSNLKRIIGGIFPDGVDKIFFDLGISMYHIKISGRGFSFSRSEPLDMRLDMAKSLKAYDVVNRFDWKKLSEIIWAYGEERHANRIARGIVNERKKKPITTSTELADIVKREIPRKLWPRNIHPATKTFQAIRVFVNDEIEILEKALRDGIDVLKPRGRICVISFHSLEDRIVKTVFSDLGRGCNCPPDFPVCVCGGRRVIKVLSRKPFLPGEDELTKNPASRSARLRFAVKLDEQSSHQNAVSHTQGEMKFSA